MVSGRIEFKCPSCGNMRFHHAKDLCQTCYANKFRKTRSTLALAQEAMRLEFGPPEEYECSCGEDAEIWFRRTALCRDCADKTLQNLRVRVKALEYALRLLKPEWGPTLRANPVGDSA
jgi:ribosomal protein L37E